MQDQIFSLDSFETQSISLTDIPEIPLYMDQIITLLEQKLVQNKRYDTDKIITKAMINNYSKEGIWSPIKGKKYSKEHIIQMLMIYQLKQVLSMADIKQVFHNKEQNGGKLEHAYTQYQLQIQQQQSSIQALMQTILQNNIVKDEQSVLELSLIFSDISNQFKRMAENLIDCSCEKDTISTQK